MLLIFLFIHYFFSLDQVIVNKKENRRNEGIGIPVEKKTESEKNSYIGY